MSVEFRRYETPNALQQQATAEYLSWAHTARELTWVATAFCLMASLYVGGRAVYEFGHWPIAVAAFVAAGLDLARPYAVLALSSDQRPGQGLMRTFAEMALFLSLISAIFVVLAAGFYHAADPLIVVPLVLAQLAAAFLPTVSIQAARSYQESYELPIVYASQPNAKVIEAPAVAAPLQITRADRIAPERQEWLWKGIVPRAEMTLVAGAGGLGKTTACLTIAAAVSAGLRLPDGSRAPHGRCLVLEAEDDIRKTTIPDLMAAEADMTRVHVIERRSHEPLSAEMLDEYAGHVPGLSLLVLSPIRLLIHDNQLTDLAVRQRLEPIVEWARRRDVTVLGIIHPPKGVSGVFTAGSAAYEQLSRMLLSVHADERDPEVRHLAVGKTNIARRSSFAFRIVGGEIGGVAAKRIEWLAGDALPAPRSFEPTPDALPDTRHLTHALPENVVSLGFPSPDAVRRRVNSSDEWLRGQLSEGPKSFRELREAAGLAGFDERTLFRAAKRIDVERDREGDKTATWRLPDTRRG